MATLRADVIRELASIRADIDRRIGALLQKLQKTQQQTTPPPQPHSEPRLRVTGDSAPADYPTDADGMFVGCPMESKFPGACVVCGQPFAKGDQIVYANKQAAHFGCGKAEPRRRGP